MGKRGFFFFFWSSKLRPSHNILTLPVIRRRHARQQIWYPTVMESKERRRGGWSLSDCPLKPARCTHLQPCAAPGPVLYWLRGCQRIHPSLSAVQPLHCIDACVWNWMRPPKVPKSLPCAQPARLDSSGEPAPICGLPGTGVTCKLFFPSSSVVVGRME